MSGIERQTDLGTVKWECSKDKYDNWVTEIHLTSGAYFRMVHHPSKGYQRTRSTIYAGRGKFVRVKMFSPDNDCIATSIEIAGYRMEWGDGDPLSAENNPIGPDLKESLQKIGEDNFEAVILVVLNAIQCRDDLWERKEVA